MVRFRHTFRTAAMAFALSTAAGNTSAQMPAPIPVKIKTNVLFIYDSSNSMWAELDGKPKYQSAQTILDDVIKGLPKDAALGLIAYGHRRKADCSDLELLAPIGTQNAEGIKSLTMNMRPTGTTPLSDALRQGADLLKNTSGAKMIVLITDGGEECQGDPCAVAQQLAQEGMVIRVNTVGLSPTDKEREQLACIAKEGAGRFFDVKDKQSLYAAVSDLKQDVLQYKKSLATEAPPPPPPDPNLLRADNGGKVEMSGINRWDKSITGKDDDFIWTIPGQEVVFSFKDRQLTEFSSFEIGIPDSMSQNVKEFELLASSYSPGGPYTSLGRFTTTNARGASLYQSFKLGYVQARYLKFKVISNYGHPVEGFGSTQVFQLRALK